MPKISTPVFRVGIGEKITHLQRGDVITLDEENALFRFARGSRSLYFDNSDVCQGDNAVFLQTKLTRTSLMIVAHLMAASAGLKVRYRPNAHNDPAYEFC